MAERKALNRFLALYLISTILLVGVGEWFYYKLAINNLIQKEKLILKTKVIEFLNQNPFLVRAIKFNNLKIPKNLKLKLYFNDKLVFSNSPILDIKVVHYELKRWGKIKIIATEKLPQDKIAEIKRSLILFNIFFLIFLIITGYFLGRMFLAPMKKVIEYLEDFIRDTTHEMNTPISVILANIELLEDNSKPIRRIKAAAIRLNKIFQDLKYVRLNHKKSKNIKEINLKEFISKRLQVFEFLAENKNLIIKTSMDEFVVNFDEEDLTRVVDNLISNAIKYAPINSEIEITLKDGIFCVINDGEIKDVEKIKKKFVRENRSEGGFGLGLYIVDKITKEYKAKFEIRNENKRVYSCIDFC